jgi:hypothetical protein
MSCATFWASFSQTHLVTLVLAIKGKKKTFGKLQRFTTAKLVAVPSKQGCQMVYFQTKKKFGIFCRVLE